MNKYKWHYDRLTAFLVVAANTILSIYISIRLLTDDYFLLTQTGLTLPKLVLVGVVLINIVFTVYLNVGFLRRRHRARLILALIQTILLACVLRNIFVGHMYFGFGMTAYIRNGICFVVLSSMIYHTLFSKQIRTYFLEEIKSK